jgi:hypothetical protein
MDKEKVTNEDKNDKIEFKTSNDIVNLETNDKV